MRILKQSSTAQPLVFLLVQTADHISGATGITPTVTLSKSGGAFASPSGAVTEIANGWYKVAGNATDTGTLGPLILHATGTGCDPVDIEYAIVAVDPQSASAFITGVNGVAYPTATPGASGGLLIAGSNAATTFSTLTISGPASIGGAFSVTGLVTYGSLTVTGPALFSSNLSVSGTTTLTGPVGFGNTFTVTGATSLAALSTSSTVTFNAFTVTGNLTVSTVVPNWSNLNQLTSDYVNDGQLNADLIGTLHDSRIAHLDADVSSRMATYTQPTGFLAATFPTTVASPTNITAGTITTVSGSVGSISGVTFPTNFSALSISATTGLVTFANTTIGTATNLTNAPTAGDFTAAMKTSLSAATPSVTVSDKTGFALTSAYDPAKTAAQAGNAMALTSGERTTLAGVFWSTLTSAITTTGSAGLALVTFLADIAKMITGSGGSTPKYTTSALSNAPSGGGGSGLSGPSSVTLAFVDADTNPVPLAEFTLLSADKSSVIGSGRADSNGVATFGTDDGDYYVTTQATSTVLFEDAALAVSGTTTQTITGTSNIPAASPDPGACAIYDTARGTDDAIKDGVVYSYKIVGGNAQTYNALEATATSSGNSANNLTFTLARGAQFVVKRGSWNAWSEVLTVPDAGSVQLDSLLTGAVLGKDAATP